MDDIEKTAQEIIDRLMVSEVPAVDRYRVLRLAKERAGDELAREKMAIDEAMREDAKPARKTRADKGTKRGTKEEAIK
jgi:hypothetical protein